MAGLYDRDYTNLTEDEEKEKLRIDAEGRRVIGAPFGRTNFRHKYPKAIRHQESLFPNNYMDNWDLCNNEDELQKQCNEFEVLLENRSIAELDIKRFIQDNKYYHIPASIFNRYNFGHHEAVLFKEFSLGTSYKVDYLLAGLSSDGWHFVYIEFENPYNRILNKDGEFGETIRKGNKQIRDWKIFIQKYYQTIATEFRKYTTKTLPDEFNYLDMSRIHYVVVAGRRNDFEKDPKGYELRRNLLKDEGITLLHYDNLLDDARALIGRSAY